MVHVAIYTLLSVSIVSLLSLVGVLSLVMHKKLLSKLLLILVSISAGTLLGGAFLHLLPEAVEDSGFTVTISLLVLAGVAAFFLLEKIIHSHHAHDHKPHKHGLPLLHESHKHHIGFMNLAGDAVHNLLDGLIIAGSFLVSVPAGVATTIAVILHEIPQEFADFGVLLYAGFSKKKAIMFNFFSAAAAIVGAILGLLLGAKGDAFVTFILPFAAGGFIYIAGANLIPELHCDCGLKESIGHYVAFLAGIGLMYGLLFLG